MNRIAILGPGLLGGSIALAASRRGLAAEVAIWGRRPEAVAQIAESEWGQEPGNTASGDLASVAAGAELLVLASPIGVMRMLADRVVRECRPLPSLAVDVGSVKGVVDREVRPIFEAAGVSLVPCHPMAGSEKTGWEHASADLFEGAACIVTPAEDADSAAVRAAVDFWQAIGSRVHLLGPDEHDAVIARVSHLPHAVASILAIVALENSGTGAALAGNGLRDTTRVAGGSPDMWVEILMENRAAVMEAMDGLQNRIGQVLAFLERKDEEGLRRFLGRAKELRGSMPE